jgi:hypothetical protein
MSLSSSPCASKVTITPLARFLNTTVTSPNFRLSRNVWCHTKYVMSQDGAESECARHPGWLAPRGATLGVSSMGAVREPRIWTESAVDVSLYWLLLHAASSVAFPNALNVILRCCQYYHHYPFPVYARIVIVGYAAFPCLVYK